MTDRNTFLRGGIPTNENGILEFKTIYPGFCMSYFSALSSWMGLTELGVDTGRTIHIHAMEQTK